MNFRFYLYCMWYIYALIFFYSIFPMLYRFIESDNSKDRRSCYILNVVTIILTIIGFIALHDFMRNMYDDHQSFMFSTLIHTEQRFPIFLSGLLLAFGDKFVYTILKSRIVFPICLFAAFFIHYLGGSFFYLLFVIYYFLALSMLRYLMKVIGHFKLLKKILDFFGQFTLELYIVQMILLPHLIHYFSYLNPLIVTIISFCICVSISYLLNYFLSFYYKIVRI